MSGSLRHAVLTSNIGHPETLLVEKAPRDLEGQLKALIEKLKKLKQQNKELRDAYRTAEADKIKLETRVEELEQVRRRVNTSYRAH